MDRSEQLRNVAFGGAWSEQIAGREALAEALAVIARAAHRADRCDLRGDVPLQSALALACRDHPKGAMLRAAWCRGAALSEPGLRRQELARIADLISAGHQGQLR